MQDFSANKKIYWKLRLASIFIVVFFVCVNCLVPVLGAKKVEKETVRVGYFPFDGYHMKDEEGKRSGYGYDILQQMKFYENWRYEYVGYEDNLSWKEALQMLEDGKIDLLTSATKSKERLEKFAYSDIPIGDSSTMITAKAGNHQFQASDYTNWNGIRVGMIANNSRNKSFAAYATKHHFTYKSVECDTVEGLTKKLQQGKVDVIVTSNLLRLSNVSRVDIFDKKPFYVIVKKGNQKLLTQVNDALQHVKEDDPSFDENLNKAYYTADTGDKVAFTKEEQQYIERCNRDGVVFTALLNPDRKPLSYYSDGKMKGLLKDLSDEIFKRSELSVQIETIKTRDEYVKRLKAGKENIICDFTGTMSAAENAGYLRTPGYYSLSTAKLVKKGYNKKGIRCALTKSSITNKGLTGNPNYKYYYYDTMEECRDAVLDGSVDFTYGYVATVQEMAYEDITNSLACIPVTEMPVTFYMGISDHQDVLLFSIMAKCVNSIDLETINYLSSPYTYYDQKQTSLLAIIYDQPVMLIVLLVFVFIMIIAGILVVMDRKKRNMERENHEKLSEALVAAKNANKAKTDFLSRVSHNMRTPLNGILGLTALMRSDTNNKKTLQDLGQLEMAGHYLLDLINDTLDVSRIESGKLTLNPTVCDGQTVFKTCLDLLMPNAKEKNISIHVDAKDIPFTMLYIDAGRFEQVVMNIMGNAIKFTPEGGTVHIVLRNLSVKDGIITDELLIRDSGIGMSQEFLKHIFEPFSQENQERTSEHEGTGLGMTITKQIMDVMGGDISVDSEIGKGTTFKLTLRFPIATQEQIDAWKRSTGVLNDEISLYHKKILLCEDHPLNTTIAVRIMESKGLIIDHAVNGKEGVETFKQSEEGYYDAILMDIRMPIMDGLEATKTIRGIDRKDAKRIPIIAMTANAFADDIQQTKEAGMDAHISKPVEPDVLFSTLKEHIKRYRDNVEVRDENE